MSDFKDRLNTERKELSDKISKLESFTNSTKFSSTDITQQALLNVQLQAMKTYRTCLIERMTSLID